MGRYTLEINKQPIEGFTKVKLDEIDKFTIDSECVYDVLEKLKLNNIKGIKNLKITYQMNRMTKQLDVALDRESDLRYIKIQPNGELDYSNRVFKRYADSFCKKIRDDKQFYEVVMSSKSITEKLKQYIQLDVENNNSY